MTNKNKGFLIPLLIIIIAIVGVGWWVSANKDNTPVLPKNADTGTNTTAVDVAVISTNTEVPVVSPNAGLSLIGFEQAVNASDWAESQKYLSNSVYVVLEGSSCCGVRTKTQAVETLKKLTDLKFTFDKNNTLVKEYLSYMHSQYPSGRKIGANVDFFTDLKIGVENDATQANKATIGYKAENGKITVLFINPGRDR